MKEEICRLSEWKRFIAYKPAFYSLIFLSIEVLLIALLPVFFHLDPYTPDLNAFGSAPLIKGHLLGTDTIGRDILSRLVYGGRISLLVSFASTLIGMLIGIGLGMLSGYFGGILGIGIMGVCDIFLAFPSIILIMFTLSIFGNSLWILILIMGLLSWTYFAKITYAKVGMVLNEDYIEGARAIGAGHWRILRKYIFLNSLGPILVATTFNMASSIIIESAMSFMGLGVQPPTASWGNMIYEAASISVMSNKIWIWLPPGLAILLTVLSINFLGDGIREVLDPKNEI